MYSNKFKEIYDAEVAKFPGRNNKPVKFGEETPIADIVVMMKKVEPGTPLKIGTMNVVLVGHYLCTGCCRFFSEGNDPDAVKYHETNVGGVPRISTCPECKKNG